MRPGDIIDGKYEVVMVLGEGGMGLVVGARHRVRGTPVAIKLLKPNYDGTHYKRFFREIRGVSQLSNDHVARVWDYGQLPDGRPYMVMELLDGPNLCTVVDARPLTSSVAARYGMQACAGLAEAHAIGIVHRDVKPANLMLSAGPTGEPIVKVVDFGIATAGRLHSDDTTDEEITAVNTVIGSVSYMSPEQLRSERDLDSRSDIWSLGVTLYELVSGRVPFPGETFAATAISIASDPHEPLPEADPVLAAIIDRCLEKDPADRFATVGELAEALAWVACAAPEAGSTTPMRAMGFTPESFPAVERLSQPVPNVLRSSGSWIAVIIAMITVISLAAAAFSGDSIASVATISRPAAAVSAAPVVAPATITVEPIETVASPDRQVGHVSPDGQVNEVIEIEPAKIVPGKRVAKRARRKSR